MRCLSTKLASKMLVKRYSQYPIGISSTGNRVNSRSSDYIATGKRDRTGSLGDKNGVKTYIHVGSIAKPGIIERRAHWDKR